MAGIRKKHSPAFKAQVAPEAARQGKTIAELAELYQVHPVQISQWKKQLLDGMETLFQAGATASQPDHEKIQTDFHEQLGRLQVELAWVGKKSAPCTRRETSLDRGGPSHPERPAAVRAARPEPGELLLPGGYRDHGELATDAADRRAVPQDAVLREPPDGRLAAPVG